MDKDMVPVSEEEEEEEEETICLELRSFHSGSPSWGRKYGSEHVWCLDLFDRPNLNRDGSSFLLRLRSATISVDSTLYVIGGILNFDCSWNPLHSSDFWYTNTYIDDGGILNFVADADVDAKVGLVKGCSMKYPRRAPSIAVVYGEIFVFGGVLPPTSVDADTWAEVYNKVSNTWSPIHPPSDFVGKLDVLRATVIDDFDDRKRKLILVCFTGPLYAYDVKFKTWQLIEASFLDETFWDDFKYCCTKNDFVAVSLSCGSQVLIMRKDWLTYGYHLQKKKWFNSPLRLSGLKNLDKDKLPPPGCLPLLLPLGKGNKTLCVLWDDNGKYTFRVYCTKLSFYQPVDEDFSLAANFVSHDQFEITTGCHMYSCFKLAKPRRGKKRAGESLYMEEEEKKKKIKEELNPSSVPPFSKI